MEQEVSTASADVIQDEQAQRPSEVAGDPSDQIMTSSERIPTQEELGKTIAGVKKEFREKGYREGYEYAMQAMQSQSQPGTQQGSSNQPPSNNKPIQPDINPQVQARQTEIRYKGMQKFDDWDATITDALREASTNPDLTYALTLAQNLPDAHEAIYKIASDEKFREELFSKHPRTWEKELLKMNKETKENVPQTVVKKVANAPVEPIKAPPASGGSTMTMSEREKFFKMKRMGIKSVS